MRGLMWHVGSQRLRTSAFAARLAPAWRIGNGHNIAPLFGRSGPLKLLANCK